ncbi:MAG: hypothetical protein ACK47H_09200, partial [Akkermansiaceae bacterium]
AVDTANVKVQLDYFAKTGLGGVYMFKFLYFSAPIFLSQVFLCVLAALREFILTPTGHLLY